MSEGGSRVSIPSNMKKMILNIKDVTGNHSVDEIYAMLKDCSMDPNETAQRLLLQDTFHEVKRKRDRRKENMNNREPTESHWRPGSQGQGSRGSRANFPLCSTSHDAGGGKNSFTGRDNGTSQVAEKGAGPSLPTSLETKNKGTTPTASSVTVMADGPAGVASGSNSVMRVSDIPAGSGVSQPEVSPSAVGISKLGIAPSNIDANKNPTVAFGTEPTHGQPAASSSSSSSPTVCFSSLDPVLVQSNDSRLTGAMGIIKREVGSQRTPSEPSAPEIGCSFMQGKMLSKAQGIMKNQVTESSQPSFVPIHHPSSVSQPPSNYSSWSQEIVGPQKVVSNKEWKPKPTDQNAAQGSGTAATSEVPAVLVEITAQSQPESSVLNTEEATSKLEKKLGELHLPQRQHVIIPNHIHVPESERTKLSFGSFDVSFGISSNYVSGQESEKSSTPLSETSLVVEETVEEQAASNQNTLTTAEVGDYADPPQSPTHVPENLSGEGDISSSAVPEYNEPKQENALLSGAQQSSVVHTNPNYNFGFVPPMLGSQFAPFENSDSQVLDVTRLPSFAVQQPFDPRSYYAQFYRSGADGDGRVSPFNSPGVATKYNGNVTVLPPQTSQPPQEGGNSLVLSTTCPTALVTQAAGLMQSSISVTQQPVPVFRPPTGVHISHYPPNYIPYGHYFSPFYVPPTIHQFLSNGAFSHQPQAGSVYPAPQATATGGAEFTLPQYKPGTNIGNSTHIGMPSRYGQYDSSPTDCSPTSAATTGNSTASEDLSASQFKENNVYMTEQQSEGSAVWIAAPGREVSSLPASSFYNLPLQGQHITFAPTQAGHGTFAGIYHSAQAVTAATVHPLLQQSQTMAGAVEMGGPAASVYQQPQHAQINRPSNY